MLSPAASGRIVDDSALDSQTRFPPPQPQLQPNTTHTNSQQATSPSRRHVIERTIQGEGFSSSNHHYRIAFSLRTTVTHGIVGMLQLTQKTTAPFWLRAGCRLSVSGGNKLPVSQRRYLHRSQCLSLSSQIPTYSQTPTWGPITILDQYATSQGQAPFRSPITNGF